MLKLTMNANEAMRGIGGRSRDLLITTERAASGGVLVTVQDTGPGLDPGNLDRLFDTFYRANSGGLGIGLSICARSSSRAKDSYGPR